MKTDFEKIYLEHRQFIRSCLYWLVRSNDIDDLVQDTFLKAWRSWEKFKGDSQVKTWLYRIAVNNAYDFLRKKKIDLESNSEAVTEHLELRDLISQALMKLTFEQREVFILYYKFGLTTLEIAQMSENSEGTVKSRLHYARLRFREFIEKQGGFDA